MKTMLVAVLTATASVTAAATADVGVNEATGAFQLAGGSSPTYVSAIGAAANPRLNGYDFGSVNALTGQSLLLQNWYFENYAYNGGSTPPGGSTNNNWLDANNVASLVVTVMQGSTQLSSNTYSLYQASVSGNNRFWQLSVPSRNTNLAAGLSNGSYSVTFTTTYNFNQYNGSTSQVNGTTSTSTGSFTVVPAPGALALIGVAGLVGARRRR
jgi:MYXO-CTERM domain-containing protein